MIKLSRRTLSKNRLAKAPGPFAPSVDHGAHPPAANPARVNRDYQVAFTLRLGHVHLKVADLARSLPFYTDLLGLRVTERSGRYAFLAMGGEHHSLALEEIGVWAVAPSRRAVGLGHVAFEVADRVTFHEMWRRLSEKNVAFRYRNNGISWAMRLKDPDQNEIEIYVDRRHAPGGTMLWEGRWHGPLKIE